MRWPTFSLKAAATGLLLVFILGGFFAQASAASQQLSGSTGIEGVIPGPPPTQAPTISLPSNGQGFSQLPIAVGGLCQSGLLVEVFTNNVFAGSRECSGGSYSLQIDLFNGRNDLVARDYDNLNQPSPDSNTVSVTFTSPFSASGPLVSITSQYAKRGADPGSVLTWPITLSGGTGPYAISVNWGDNTNPDLVSEQFAGNINLQHTYKSAGVYNVTIQATDANGETAFLQVVGVGNGPIQQATSNQTTIIKVERVVPWWAIALLFILTFLSFWLGKKHQLQTIRARLRKGQAPYG